LFQTLVDDDEIRITHVANGGGKAVVSFTGIGLGMGGMLIEEFAGTLSRVGGASDLYFVIDKRRSWYNSNFERIRALLEQALAKRPIDEVITIGHSMGGSGALLFGNSLPKCTIAIAFGPQASIHASIVPEETRWKRLREAIPNLQPRNFVDVAQHGPCANFIFYSAANEKDEVHARLFRAAHSPRMKVFMLDFGNHNPARALKWMGQLDRVVEILVGQERDKVAALCATFGELLVGELPPGDGLNDDSPLHATQTPVS
jgi:pimeloyl-ACP methyl ester carboxylesterase